MRRLPCASLPTRSFRSGETRRSRLRSAGVRVPSESGPQDAPPAAPTLSPPSSAPVRFPTPGPSPPRATAPPGRDLRRRGATLPGLGGSWGCNPRSHGTLGDGRSPTNGPLVERCSAFVPPLGPDQPSGLWPRAAAAAPRRLCRSPAPDRPGPHSLRGEPGPGQPSGPWRRARWAPHTRSERSPGSSPLYPGTVAGYAVTPFCVVPPPRAGAVSASKPHFGRDAPRGGRPRRSATARSRTEHACPTPWCNSNPAPCSPVPSGRSAGAPS